MILRLRIIPALALVLACTPGGGGTGTGSSEGGSSTGPGASTSTTSTTSAGTTEVDPTTSGPGGTATTTAATTASTGTSEGSSSTTDDSTTGAVLDHFLIGVDVADVSPSADQIGQNNIYMGAYGAPFTRGPAKGVHDPIYARSFAYEAEGGALLLSIVDLPGMGNQNTRALRTKVAALTGLAEEQVMVGTTHTHSSPDFMGLWGGIPGSYRDELLDNVAMSMAAAWESRVPGTLRVAAGKAPNNNRRGWPFTDDDMIVLDAFDMNDQRIGTLVNFAAHPVVLGEDNKLISCDYTGYVVGQLEAELGAPAGLFNGTLGDATPKVPEGMYADDFERAKAYGELLAGLAIELTATSEAIEPTLVWSYKSWEQSVDNFLFQLAGQLGILQYDFETQGLMQKVTTQAVYFRLGKSVQGVAFPGESLTRNGLAIKEVMKAPHKMILGNTGDALGYFVPSDEWQTGKNDNYEESVSLGKTAGDNARDNITPMIEADNNF